MSFILISFSLCSSLMKKQAEQAYTRVSKIVALCILIFNVQFFRKHRKDGKANNDQEDAIISLSNKQNELRSRTSRNSRGGSLKRYVSVIFLLPSSCTGN